MGLTKIHPSNVKERISGAKQDLQLSESAFENITRTMDSLSTVWRSDAQQQFVLRFSIGKSEIQKFNEGISQHLALINTITDEWNAVDTSIANPVKAYVSTTPTNSNSANVLDDAYLSEYAKNCARMRQLLVDAESELDKADNNTGWHCKEKGDIADRIATMRKKIRALEEKFDAIANAVKTGNVNYLNWEQKNVPLADGKAEEISKSFNYNAKTWAKGVADSLANAKNNAASNLSNLLSKLIPTTTIPKSPVPTANVAEPTDWWTKSGKE